MSARRAASLALLAQASPRIARADDPVCQVMTQPDTSLQTALGIKCNITNNTFGIAIYCNCTWPLVDHSTWVPIEGSNGSYDFVLPGKWIPTSPDGKCVALSHNGNLTPKAVELSCPPGFYCKGGRHPPLSCRKGDHCPGNTAQWERLCPADNFCPVPSGPIFPCPKGALCPPGSGNPDGCQSGFYCEGGVEKPCPQGYWCAFGTDEPVKCGWFSLCPLGSMFETRIAAFLWVIIPGVAFAVGAAKYHVILQRGIWVFSVCALLVFVMWFIDLPIAGWLTLNLLLIAANWAVLRLDKQPPIVAQSLMVMSLVAAVWALWIVNEPWAVLVAGLLYVSILGWMMSRQDQRVVWSGRALLALTFVGMCIGFWIVDPQFTLLVILLLLIVVLMLAASWAIDQRRQKASGQPLSTRWPFPDGDSGEVTPPANGTGSFTTSFNFATQWTPAVVRATNSGLLETAPPTDILPTTASAASLRHAPSAHSSYSTTIPASEAAERGSQTGRALQTEAADRSRTEGKGVSFSLKNVDFYLLDGKQLLKSINLKIEPGRQVAVMGPSGGGKSTLLAVLSGRASYGRMTGKLLVSGHAADDLRFLKDVTGFVPQDDILHGELTVEENIRYQAALRMSAEVKEEEVAQSCAQVIHDLNLEAVAHSRVGTPEQRGVSGGQRKRVSIAMELVSQPLLLFADEPTSGLDSTTSHEVVDSLTKVARSLNTTTAAVIHQPRYETLQLFDDLVLLGFGGCLIYAGPTCDSVEHFQCRLQVIIPANVNPADVILDSIRHDPESFAQVWRDHCRALGPPQEEAPVCASTFYRQRAAFFQAVLIFMDRSMLQCFRAYKVLLINQILCVATIFCLCKTIKFARFDQFMMQGAFAALFLMLLQGVAAQRIFGADLLITWREARVGAPMVAYLVAKDLAALFEVTLAATVFTFIYGLVSGSHIALFKLFAGSWAFVYCVFGLSYICSIVLSAGAAQMTAVVSAFLAFCVAGAYQPLLPDIAAMGEGRGWMVPALSPVRWMFGFLVTDEAHYLTDLSKEAFKGKLAGAGYDLDYLDMCQVGLIGRKATDFTLQQDWLTGRSWVCSTAPLLLLGIIFRFLAGVCLVLFVNAQTSGWARFFAQSSGGVWKLVGRLFTLLLGAFLALFLFAEIWVFGLLKFEMPNHGLPVPKHDGQVQTALAGLPLWTVS